LPVDVRLPGDVDRWVYRDRDIMTEPPYVLDSARVLAYAVLDQTVSYTGRISVYVGGKLLSPVPRLAICENLARDGDFLLFYCTETWEVLGVGGYDSFEFAKQRAEWSRMLGFRQSGNLIGLFQRKNWLISMKFDGSFGASRQQRPIPNRRKGKPNPRLKTDVENARLSGSLIRHGLAV